MTALLIFAFLSGLVTLFAPCIWPLLPIILSSTTSGGRARPFGITVGIMVSFAFFTLTISYIVKIIPFDPNALRLFAVFVIGFFGLTLVIPSLSQLVEGYVSKIVAKSGASKSNGSGLWGGLLIGLSLGIVWSPCAGPILATIATLAATQKVNWQIIVVTIVYVLGVGIPLFFFATAGSVLFAKSRFLNRYTHIIQQVFGVIMILTAFAIYTNFDKVVQVKLLEVFPSYSSFLSDLEGNTEVLEELKRLKGTKPTTDTTKIMDVTNQALPNLGNAPEFVGISRWLNSEKLTMESLIGKVVLIDFWTYTCINCIRTLPHVTGWYEKYKDQGLVVIGVHTPEFEFEKKSSNVEGAIKQFNIRYPVAQDNDYETWNAYDNHYWPAKYLIDAQGAIRYTHFGEGEYAETEKVIQNLIKEAGNTNMKDEMLKLEDKTPRNAQSPETYIGILRIERNANSNQPKAGTQIFELPQSTPLHYFAFGGRWNVMQERSTTVRNSTLQFQFLGGKAFLVMSPRVAGSKVKVFLNGSLVDSTNAGSDVTDGIVTLDTERLYHLIDLKGKRGEYELQLQFDDGISVYAFTFG